MIQLGRFARLCHSSLAFAGVEGEVSAPPNMWYTDKNSNPNPEHSHDSIDICRRRVQSRGRSHCTEGGRVPFGIAQPGSGACFVGTGGAGCREDFERSLPAVSNEANCSVLRLAIESLDAADEQLISDGHVYHCGPQTPTTMMSSFGLVPYERRRYRSRGCASIAPADDRFGIVNGFWSPLVAHHGLRALAPVGDCAEMFGELGGMSPSATALNHLVETVGAVLFFTLSRQK